MIKQPLLLLVLLPLLTSCEGSSKPLDVRVLPSGYQVGSIKSQLATPIVDEVVRLKPKHVLMSFCPSTPPAKTIQFIDELRARIHTDLKGIVLEHCPES